MIRCYHCGTDNLDGSEYCDECGKKLNASSNPARPAYLPPPPLTTQAGPPPPPSFTRESITPKPATPYTPPPPPVHPPAQQTPQRTEHQQAPSPNANNVPGHQHPTTTTNGPMSGMRGGNPNAESGQQAKNSDLNDTVATPVRAKLIIQRGGKVGKEFPIVGNESMIGRWDADGGIFPDIDLDQDDPEAKVSRRHARIQFVNNQYLIEDLGSTNGTFINRGPRLLPGNKQPLNNGDEIIVGKTFLKFVLS
ncbi:MAG: FHA domain-containing protein [Acidobacteria bacterium]|nr:FHA domain-containing protein [Acidobacteriota bacterium]